MTGDRPFLPALTGLRAFAAVWVVLLHLSAVLPALAPVAWSSIRWLAIPGFLGVDVFFVLSGFILSYNYEALFAERFRRGSYVGFLRARLARIYPLHLFLLLALVLAVRGFGLGAPIDPARFSSGQLIESVLLVHAWLGHADAWNSVSWSLSLEWLAYLCFPLAIWLARGASRARDVGLWCMISTVACVPAALARVTGSVNGEARHLLAQVAAEFVIGCVLYQMFRERRSRGGLVRWPGASLLGLVAGGAALGAIDLPPAWIVPLVPPLVLGLAYGAGRASTFFASPAVVYVGRISFALYLSHYLWLWVMHSVVAVATLAEREAVARFGLLIAHTVPMLLIAAVLYHVIEQPARLWLSRSARRQPVSA